jgi:hypothetical protein
MPHSPSNAGLSVVRAPGKAYAWFDITMVRVNPRAAIRSRRYSEHIGLGIPIRLTIKPLDGQRPIIPAQSQIQAE